MIRLFLHGGCGYSHRIRCKGKEEPPIIKTPSRSRSWGRNLGVSGVRNGGRAAKPFQPYFILPRTNIRPDRFPLYRQERLALSKSGDRKSHRRHRRTCRKSDGKTPARSRTRTTGRKFAFLVTAIEGPPSIHRATLAYCGEGGELAARRDGRQI